MTGAAYSNPDLGENSERAAREGPRADIAALRMNYIVVVIASDACLEVQKS